MSDRRTSADHASDAHGGDAACWLDRVCAECGAVLEVADREHVCRHPVAHAPIAE